MRKLISVISILLFFSFWSCNAQNGGSEIQHVGVAEFEQAMKIEGAQLIDVRTTNEYRSGHIEGASLHNIRNIDFEENMDKLDKNKPVLVYCKSGGRSSRAASVLQKKGFTNIYNLEGGFTAWSQKKMK